MSRIDRTGTLHFGDASLSIWEEGLGVDWDARQAWKRQFKRDVFARIVQTLNRLGWKVGPQHYIFTDNDNRFCQKGDLKGDLHMSGRHIKFEMFQSINCPKRADHEGRHEWNKAELMPYTMRLEMERTRRRIRDYLVAVFTGYSFDQSRRGGRTKPLEFTALERVAQHYAESSHFKGDLTRYTISAYNRETKDGAMLEHGQRVWFFDEYTGRAGAGIAYYNINNMWWVVTGRYDYRNLASFQLYTRPPENLRLKRNADRRRKRLEQELARAIAAMNFERAAVLRDVLFPPGTGPLFHVRVKKGGLLWGPNSSGYTKDSLHAGKYTKAEAERIVRHSGDRLEAMEVTHAHA